MAARVEDLEIVDREGLAYFQFRWSGSSEEWRAALHEIKQRLEPGLEREFDEVSKLWRVSCACESVLAEIFPNFAGAADGIRSQMSMFGELA